LAEFDKKLTAITTTEFSTKNKSLTKPLKASSGLNANITKNIEDKY